MQRFLKSRGFKIIFLNILLIVVVAGAILSYKISKENQAYKSRASEIAQTPLTDCKEIPPENVTDLANEPKVEKTEFTALKSAQSVLVKSTSSTNKPSYIENANIRKQGLMDLMRTDPDKARRFMLQEQMKPKSQPAGVTNTDCFEKKVTLTGTIEELIVDGKPEYHLSDSQKYIRLEDGTRFPIHTVSQVKLMPSTESVTISGYQLDKDVLVESSSDVQGVNTLSQVNEEEPTTSPVEETPTTAPENTATPAPENTTAPTSKPSLTPEASAAPTSKPTNAPTDTPFVPQNAPATLAALAYPDSVGNQRVGVLMPYFQGQSAPSIPKSRIANLVYISTNDYFKRASNNRVTILGNDNDVYDWKQMGVAHSCESYSVMTAAIQAYDAQVNFAQYDRIMLIIPYSTGCPFGGMGTVGKIQVPTGEGTVNISVSWIVAEYMREGIPGGETYWGVLPHEFGHNLGMGHANSYSCTSDIITGCTFTEYGDQYDVMGNAYALADLNAPHKEFMGFLSTSNVHVPTIYQSIMSIIPIEQGSTAGDAGVKTIRIPRDGNGSMLYVEARANIQNDLDLYKRLGVSNPIKGVLIHLEGEQGYNYNPGQSPVIVDASNPHNDTFNAFVPMGSNSFRDPVSGATVQYLDNDASGNPRVNILRPKTDVTNPTVSITSPQNYQTVQSGNITLNVTASDASGIRKIEVFNEYDQIIGTVNAATGTINLPANQQPSGWHYYYAKAYDKAGQQGQGMDNSEYSYDYVVVMVESPQVPVYRFRDPKRNIYFYTASEEERANTIKNFVGKWQYQDIAFYVTIQPNSRTVPVYRFRDEKLGVHFYTASEEEKANTIVNYKGKWIYEGIAYYVYIPPNQEGYQPIFRFRDEKLGVHSYIGTTYERDQVNATQSQQWKYEGIAYYGYPF